jgi:hypothetical protein
MLWEFLTKVEPVHIATNAAEREAVYRFRYTVFVEELGREIGGVDHENRWVRDQDDEGADATHIYTKTGDVVTGSVRLRCWEPGSIPDPVQRRYSMDQVPRIESLSAAESDRLMIAPTLRGRLILPSIVRTMYEIMVGERGVDIGFGCCGPGLVPHYRKLGFRPYRAELISTPEGMRIPLIGIPSDLDYARRHGSLLVPLIKKYFGPGKRAPLDLEPFHDLFESGSLAIELDSERVWRTLQDEILHDDHELPSFLDSLPERTVRKLSDRGFVLQFPDGALLTKEGFSEQEMFVVLSGSFEVIRGGRRIALANRGDLLGEVAFFRESGKRSASIRAFGKSQVLLIRRRFLEEYAKEDPEAALQVLFSLGRILSGRLVAREVAQSMEEPEAGSFGRG